MENTSTDGVTSIMQLPDDCLSFIFQQLKGDYDQQTFGLTCHRWLNIQNVNRKSLQFSCCLWHFPDSALAPKNSIIQPNILQRLLVRFQNLERLCLSGYTVLCDSELTNLQFLKKLQSLNLDCCFGITDDGLSHVAASCPSLMAISLYRCNISDLGLENLASGCLTLMKIDLSHCASISDRGLKALSQACCHLYAIKVSNCRKVSGTGLLGCSKTLAYVDVESCNPTPEGIAGIFSGGGLEYLSAINISWPNHGMGLAAIDGGLAANLKTLNLRSCRSVDDNSILAIAKGCPLLQELNLTLCHEVRIPGWQSVGLYCNKLEKLHVNRCKNLCDAGLQALREGCKKLVVLYIGRTNDRLSPIAKELFKLNRGEVQIKEEEIVSIAPEWMERW